jgi:hypothetical protein
MNLKVHCVCPFLSIGSRSTFPKQIESKFDSLKCRGTLKYG